MEKSKRSVLFVVNDLNFFLSHRLPIAIQARLENYEVHIASKYDLEAVLNIESHGVIFHSIPFSRSSCSIFSEIKVFYQLFSLIKSLKPGVVHLVTIKPVLYGGIVCRILGVKRVVAAISGLGYVFITDGLRAEILRTLIVKLYKLALSSINTVVIFQNRTDMATFIDLGVVNKSQVELIRGAGVDLREYSFNTEINKPIKVVLAARLLKDKGVLEYLSAVRELNRRGVSAQYKLVGDIDLGNPSSFSQEELIQIQAEGIVDVEGFVRDIPKLFSDANIVVLPSYREGLPKVLIESAACGRAVVTTDVPGCRDAIISNKTGVLVPVKDSLALADAIQLLVEDDQMRNNMGKEGRLFSERTFDIQAVVKRHLELYEK